jgi:hypothetical protein
LIHKLILVVVRFAFLYWINLIPSPWFKFHISCLVHYNKIDSCVPHFKLLIHSWALAATHSNHTGLASANLRPEEQQLTLILA